MSFCIASAEASTPEWRVGNADDLQQALQRAVLARPAVQHVERDVGLELRASVAAMSRATSTRLTR